MTRWRMPAEWERHDATWIAWPHHEPDWPRKLEPVQWVYAEIVRVLARHERVEVLCNSEALRESAAGALRAHDVAMQHVNLPIVQTDRVWLRDSAPSFVWNESGEVEIMAWDFNAWAKYDNYTRDREVPNALQHITGLPSTCARRPDDPSRRLVLEGGGIDVNGQGRILVTEEWLLSDVQVRNPGMTRADYERAFAEYLGCPHTIWLGNGCAGDDTHGHVDDIARFVSPDTVVLAYEEDPADANHASSVDNLERLRHAAAVQPLDVVLLPYPRPVIMDGQRLPASYANFYVANDVVIVPTFNDANDRIALNTLAAVFPTRTVVGIHAVDLVWGLGTLHCLTQQQPAMSLTVGELG
ncbi:MAG TPA: agmatine deiminase family protein [Candidatus Elarobacter sp.]|nr:agmatine deiminase family protein [Candidatus Elarobacter sp.]